MPYKPKKINRPWQKKTVKQSRVNDMSWFYQDKRWRKFSKGFKVRHPFCVRCAENDIVTPSCVTDHKVRYVDGGKGFDLDDLKDEYFEPLCDYRFNKCHEKKSGKEAHGYKKGMG